MQKIWLQTELGCNSYVREYERSSQGIKGVIVDSSGEGEESDSRDRSRVRARFLEGCRGRMLVRIQGGSISKVRVTVQFSRRITVWQV